MFDIIKEYVDSFPDLKWVDLPLQTPAGEILSFSDDVTAAILDSNVEQTMI